MKVVIVVHYFPPINSSGTRRVLALSKYLVRFGHEVTFITTKKRRYDGAPIEPMPTYCDVIEVGGKSKLDIPQKETEAISKTKDTSGRSGWIWKLILFRRSLTKIFGQLVDHRIFFAFRFLIGALPKEAIDAIQAADVVLSSCPPWPVHLAGYYITKKYQKPWIADYRDHFSGYHFIAGNKISAAIEAYIDKILLSRAAAVTTISTPMSKYYESFHNRVVTIENGYDEEFIQSVRDKVTQMSEQKQDHGVFTVRYLGSITRDRIPVALFSALRSLTSVERQKFIFEIYGESALLQEAIGAEFSDLIPFFKFYERVSYSKSIELMLTADALLFMETSSQESLSTQGTLTTKLFEYIAVEKPIIAEISAETLIGQIINKSHVGLVISSSAQDIEVALRKILTEKIKLIPDQTFIKYFSREVQAKNFESLFKKLLVK